MAAFAVNDNAFVPANQRQRGFSQIEHRENIGPEGALQLFGADFLDAIPTGLLGGVIYQNVKRAEFALNLTNDFAAVLFRPHIAGQ